MIRIFTLVMAAIGSLMPDAVLSAPAPASSLDFEMKTLDGISFNFGDRYRGKVVLIVNLPYRCGFLAPGHRMERFQRLHDKYSGRGLAIVAAPCEQFVERAKTPHVQAPTAREFKECCEKHYGVEFDLLAKLDVSGRSQSPLYAYLIRASAATQGTRRQSTPVSWDFETFLLARDGRFLQRFVSRDQADSTAVTSVIERTLADSPDGNGPRAVD